MNDNNFGAPSPLDDIQYGGAAKPNNGAPAGISAPVLDDIEYVAPTAKKGGPTGVAAPVLDDMDSYTPQSQKKGAPTGVAAPVLDDNSVPYTAAPKDEPIVMTDEEIIAKFTPDQLVTYNGLPEKNKQAVLDHMRRQLGAVAPVEEVTAPVLDEDNYTPPPKKETPPPQPEAPVSAPVLDEAPPPAKYVPKYVDEDLEKAKREAAKKAVAGQLVSDQKDSKESLRMMLELKEQLRREQAAKGFKVVIVLALLGIVGAISFGLLYSGSLGLGYKNGMEGFAGIISNSSLYIGLAMALSGLLLLTGAGICKTLASLIYLLSGIIQLFPGIVMIPQHEGSLALVGILYGVSLVCTVAVFAGLSAIESVGLFFNKKLRE